MPKKLKIGPFGIFQHPLCRKTSKNEGGPLEGKNCRKVTQCRKKTERGDPLVSPGIIVCYAEKEHKLFGSVR